jgi:hypothetical protein
VVVSPVSTGYGKLLRNPTHRSDMTNTLIPRVVRVRSQHQPVRKVGCCTRAEAVWILANGRKVETHFALLSSLLGITIFLTTLEMFGEKAAVFAVALFCFDPNFLAHGSFVTTDIGASLTLLLSTFCFYRVLKRPSAGRMVVLGITIGMTFTAKFTGIFIIPMLVLSQCSTYGSGVSSEPPTIERLLGVN